jgi:hypothetical protein
MSSKIGLDALESNCTLVIAGNRSTIPQLSRLQLNCSDGLRVHLNQLDSITGIDLFGVATCFSHIIDLFSGTNTPIRDKVEVWDFVPKLETLVLSVLDFQSSSLSLKFTYLRAFFCHTNSDNQRHSTNQRLRKTLVSYTTNVISPFYSEPLRP